MRLKTQSPKHVARATLLRQMRKDCGLTQQEIALQLFISRETVVAIENAHEKAIFTLENDIFEKWVKITKGWKRYTTACAFKEHVMTSYHF